MILNSHEKNKTVQISLCLLSHSQLEKVGPKHPLIFLDVSLYYSSSERPEACFFPSPEKNPNQNQKSPTRAKSVSAKFVSNTTPIHEATDECSSKLQGIKTTFL